MLEGRSFHIHVSVTGKVRHLWIWL